MHGNNEFVLYGLSEQGEWKLTERLDADKLSQFLRMKLNPGQNLTAELPLSGSGYFDRSKLCGDGNAILLRSNQISKEIYREIASKKAHTSLLHISAKRVLNLFEEAGADIDRLYTYRS